MGYQGNTQSNIVIRDNDISDVAVGISVATAVNGVFTSAIDHLEICGNRLHDFSSMIVNSIHGDGIQIWTNSSVGATPSVSGSIYNNTFSGSVARSSATGHAAMTAWIYLDGSNGYFAIYNNALSYSDVPTSANLFEALISLRANNAGTTQIYNNTLSGTVPGMSAAILVERSQNVTVKNNILRGMQYCFYLVTSPGFTSDYNMLSSTFGASAIGSLDGVFMTFNQWQALGNDTHGSVADPLVTLPPGDLSLESGSPAIGSATDLSTVFTNDRAGKTRTLPWDMGAYAYEPSPFDQDNDGLPDAWELSYWPTTAGHGPLDDADRDGYVELVEMALGLDPTTPDTGGLPFVVNDGGYLTLTLVKLPGITYEVQSAGTLRAGQPDSFSADSTFVLINDAYYLRVRDTVLIGSAPARYLRVKVTAVP